MEGPQPKTPTGITPSAEGGGRSEAVDGAATPSADVETPQATSISRSAPDELRGAVADGLRGDGRRGWAALFGWPVRRAAIAVAGSAAAILGGLIAAHLGFGSGSGVTPAEPHVAAATLAASLAAAEAVVDAGPGNDASDAHGDGGVASPRWRVAQLESDPSVVVVHEPLGHRPLLSALAAAHVTGREAARVTSSLAEVRNVDRLEPKDEVTVALDRATHRVVAYELASSPTEVWQAREAAADDGSLRLRALRLDIEASRVRVGKAVLVGPDLRASLADAGLTPVDDVLSMLDDALDGHAEISDIRPGARLRLLATQELIDGAFVRWLSLDAVEYFPASPGAPSVRVYAFSDGEGAAGDAKRHHGWFDAKGRQPFHGGFRSPVPLARITSRFNPHRMHPVLHVVMPHNGIDFAAPVGAPVYATAGGVVASISHDGPCGNHVEISHADAITSVYCHLSRFGSGLHVGQHVEQRQLIGYVGQTGRVTGPHLHFGIRKNGVFVDPMNLRLDGVRIVPRGKRDEFDARRADLDSELDGIPLPPSSGAPVDVSEPDTFYEEP